MRGTRALFADTSASLRAECQAALGGSGFEVEVAADGLECVAKLRAFRPDVLILDPEVPWGGGDGVLARLAEDADLPAVAVVILYGPPPATSSANGRRRPVDAYFVKPRAPAALAGDVRRLLRDRMAQAAAH